MAMTSKHRLTSRDDIELPVVVKLCVGLIFLNTPADRANDTDLEIDMFYVSLLL